MAALMAVWSGGKAAVGGGERGPRCRRGACTVVCRTLANLILRNTKYNKQSGQVDEHEALK